MTVTTALSEITCKIEQTQVQVSKLLTYIESLNVDVNDLEKFLQEARENIDFLNKEAKIVSLNQYYLCKADIAKATAALNTTKSNIRVYQSGVANLKKEIGKLQKEVERLTPRVIEFPKNGKK